MKKFLSLMIVTVMVISCFALNAFAAEEVNLAFTASEADSNGVFTVSVTADKAVKTFMLCLAFDTTKVLPVDTDGNVVEGEQVDFDVVDVTYNETFNVTPEIYYYNGEFVSIYTSFASSSSNVAVGETICTYKFKKMADVASSDVVFELNTTEVNDDGWFLDAIGEAHYVARLESDGKTVTQYTTVTPTFDTSKIVDEEPDPDPVYTWGSATADEVTADETGVTGAKVAVFGKVSGGAGKVLADGEYWVTFGENTYLGKASTEAVTAWAIVIFDPEGKKVEAGRTYGYTAGMTGVESWTGSVTAAAAE